MRLSARLAYKVKLITALTMVLALSACTTQGVLVPNTSSADPLFRSTKNINPLKKILKNTTPLSALESSFSKPSLSAGDKIQIDILEGEDFSGRYTIDIDGDLKIPYFKAIKAQGLTLEELKHSINEYLLSNNIVKKEFIDVSITPVQWSASFINVSGAVYKPGNTLINERTKEEYLNPIQTNSGDFANKKLLSSALKAAGGVKPDADLSSIKVIRNGIEQVFDMTGVLSGKAFIDPSLAANDEVIVPSVGYMQKALLRPSRITPPGVRVFLSNLTSPAGSNTAAAIGKYSSNLPLGSRLLTAAMSANCVGGTASINAKRSVILIGNDPRSDRQKTMMRNLSVILNAPNSDIANPYILPNDMVACYDSNITNWRDIARTMADLVSPAALFRGGL